MLPKVGQTIELINMPDDPNPIPSGSRGVVKGVYPMPQGQYQVDVAWANGRGLMLIIPIDTFKVVED